MLRCKTRRGRFDYSPKLAETVLRPSSAREATPGDALRQAVAGCCAALDCCKLRSGLGEIIRGSPCCFAGSTTRSQLSF
jgi:hypothetical protein